jgi:hydrogenase expression/formation protein HypC
MSCVVLSLKNTKISNCQIFVISPPDSRINSYEIFSKMCLAVPGKVISIDKSDPELRMAKVDFSGVTKEISVQWLPEVKVGDYILAHVGMALNILNEDEALETLRLLKELGEIDPEPGKDGW